MAGVAKGQSGPPRSWRRGCRGASYRKLSSREEFQRARSQRGRAIGTQPAMPLACQLARTVTPSTLGTKRTASIPEGARVAQPLVATEGRLKLVNATNSRLRGRSAGWMETPRVGSWRGTSGSLRGEKQRSDNPQSGLDVDQDEDDKRAPVILLTVRATGRLLPGPPSMVPRARRFDDRCASFETAGP